MNRTRPELKNYRQMKSDIETVSNALQKGKSVKQQIDAILKWRGAILDRDDPDRADCLPFRPELIDEFLREIEDNRENLDEDYKPAYWLELKQLMSLVEPLINTLSEEKIKAKAMVEEAHSSLSDMERDHTRPPKFNYSYNDHSGPDYPQRRQEAFEKHRIEWETWSNTPDGDDWTEDYKSYKGGWRKATEYAQKLELLFDDIVIIKKIVAVNIRPLQDSSAVSAGKSLHLIPDKRQALYEALIRFVDDPQQSALFALIVEGKLPDSKIILTGQIRLFGLAFFKVNAVPKQGANLLSEQLPLYFLHNDGKGLNELKPSYIVKKLRGEQEN